MIHILRTASALFILLTSIGAYADNKVVVIPMAADTANALKSCVWKYQFHASVVRGTAICPVNTFAINGSCGSVSGAITNSRPESIGGGSADPAEDATGWTCHQSNTGSLDVRALCCPK